MSWSVWAWYTAPNMNALCYHFFCVAAIIIPLKKWNNNNNKNYANVIWLLINLPLGHQAYEFI